MKRFMRGCAAMCLAVLLLLPLCACSGAAVLSRLPDLMLIATLTDRATFGDTVRLSGRTDLKIEDGGTAWDYVYTYEESDHGDDFSVIARNDDGADEQELVYVGGVAYLRDGNRRLKQEVSLEEAQYWVYSSGVYFDLALTYASYSSQEVVRAEDGYRLVFSQPDEETQEEILGELRSYSGYDFGTDGLTVASMTVSFLPDGTYLGYQLDAACNVTSGEFTSVTLCDAFRVESTDASDCTVDAPADAAEFAETPALTELHALGDLCDSYWGMDSLRYEADLDLTVKQDGVAVLTQKNHTVFSSQWSESRYTADLSVSAVPADGETYTARYDSDTGTFYLNGKAQGAYSRGDMISQFRMYWEEPLPLLSSVTSLTADGSVRKLTLTPSGDLPMLSAVLQGIGLDAETECSGTVTATLTVSDDGELSECVYELDVTVSADGKAAQLTGTFRFAPIVLSASALSEF